MRSIITTAKLAAGSVLFAAVMYVLLALPGLITANGGALPDQAVRQVRR